MSNSSIFGRIIYENSSMKISLDFDHLTILNATHHSLGGPVMQDDIKKFILDKLLIAVINALILGLIATAITDRWEYQRRQSELKLNLLKDFEDRSNRLIACMMAPRAMVQDRECLVVELDLVGMESTFQVVYDTTFHEDFVELGRIVSNTQENMTKGQRWVLSDEAFAQFRVNYTDRTRLIRQKILQELGR